ncbi:hypothetical protein [Nitrospirillum iridis]|uniref:Phosphatidylinositol diacylglycerol-lyase n=1 Tax=Nitrospirillum iridis TaxID=765888 RepID=A0A7X0EG88_9PROT|nr:hypothetical protein [Nitrospirillum iridis]MBB6254730.1 hypothetical protein [Nitrospirillum iridis]
MSFPDHVLFGYSRAAPRAFTQAMDNKTKLGPDELWVGQWSNDWVGFDSFSINGTQYVCGVGGLHGTVFIQKILANGVPGQEVYREKTAHAWYVCAQYQVSGHNFILFHGRDNDYEIRKLDEDGRILPGAIQKGRWKAQYSSVFSVIFADGRVYLCGFSSTTKRFFTQPVKSDGSLAADESYSSTWSSIYNPVIPVKLASGRVFVWGQTASKNYWFLQEMLSDGSLVRNESDNGRFGDHYQTATAVTIDGVTYLMAQTADSNKKFFTQIVQENGKLAKEETQSNNFRNYYTYFSVYKTTQIAPEDGWMTKNYNYIHNKTLKEIVIPGAHDAGMSDSIDCTSTTNAVNTRTQVLGMAGQLSAGCRYFDLRPIVSVEPGKGAESSAVYLTGHFSEVPVVGIQGCFGQDMNSIIHDIQKFSNDKNHRNELIILKFSHYAKAKRHNNSPSTVTGFGWDPADKRKFADFLRNNLGDLLVTNRSDRRIGTFRYDEIMACGNKDKAKILVVIDGLPSDIRSPETGIFRYHDYPYDKYDPDFISPNVDLCVYDEYSSTNEYWKMEADQFAKMDDPANHGGDMYVLSWTLTQSDGQAALSATHLPQSILDLAREANGHLGEAVGRIMEKNKKLWPSVLYVDNVDPSVASLCELMVQKP